MRGSVFSVLVLVRIIKVPDKRGPDNRGCTVLAQGEKPSSTTSEIAPFLRIKGIEQFPPHNLEIILYKVKIPP